jgi:hypothetical protein
MTIYLAMPVGKEFDAKDIRRLEVPKVAMLSVIMPQTRDEKIYVMLAPSECHSGRKLQAQWGFELRTPKNIRQIVHPSGILKSVEGEVEVEKIRQIYLGCNMVGRMLSDMGARPEQYDRIRHITEEFNHGIGRLAKVSFL